MASLCQEAVACRQPAILTQSQAASGSDFPPILPCPGVPIQMHSFEHSILKINSGNHRLGSGTGTLLFIVSWEATQTAGLTSHARPLLTLSNFNGQVRTSDCHHLLLGPQGLRSRHRLICGQEFMEEAAYRAGLRDQGLVYSFLNS